jgi:6-pyruvoyltetrahydropterin/6-carboxytetrahydropterin synthase
MERWTLRKTLEVDGAHRLAAHPGKCSNLHGHRWRVTVAVATSELGPDGMVLDFGTIAQVVRQMDHATVLDATDVLASELGADHAKLLIHGPPTAENLARHIADRVAADIDRPAVVEVTVEESPGSEVTYRR